LKRQRLFGTDGIRGVAGKPPLDPRTLAALGEALADLVRDGTAPPRVLVARDTRESGPEIARVLAASLQAAGARVEMGGVLPTPVLALLTRSGGYRAGVMVSASHNPYMDNGVKVISSEGTKLADDLEDRLEERMRSARRADGGGPGATPAEEQERFEALYLREVERRLGSSLDLGGLKVALDCAEGAASHLAPRVFEALGAQVRCIHCRPDGRNINLRCGSLHPEDLAREVVAAKCDLGIAFDGDADRALVVDERGRLLDGDFLLWRSALDLKAEGRLAGSTVVATVMSNLWLESTLEREGIALRRAAVGDRYVLEEMQRCGAVLGGEQSGHIIYLGHSTTGDGILTGLRLAASLRRAGERLSAWSARFTPCPQVLLNVRVGAKPDLAAHPVIGAALRQAEGELGRRGRLLVRYSGTESLARVMVEGEDEGAVRGVARRLADLIEREVGAGSESA
jgi:phosphoglucosamine mutase